MQQNLKQGFFSGMKKGMKKGSYKGKQDTGTNEKLCPACKKPVSKCTC